MPKRRDARDVVNERHELRGVGETAQQRDAVAEPETFTGRIRKWQFQRVHFSMV